MKTILEYLIGKNKTANDPLKNIKFEFDIDDEAKDIFDPDNNEQVMNFKDKFLDLSDNAYKFLNTIKLKIRVKPKNQLRDNYSFYVRFNQLDEYYEKWEFNKKNNKFEKPESNCHQYYGREWYKRDSAIKSIIENMIERGIYDLQLKR